MKKEYRIRNHIWCVLFGTLLVVVLSACGKSTSSYLDTQTLEEVGESEILEELQQTQAQEVSDTIDEALIYVYICGEIKSPGVYALPEGSRLIDLFTKAGGLTKRAAKEYWNQAQLLEDGQMYYVPAQEETEAEKYSFESSKQGDFENVVSDGKININTASKEQLMQIPGIGEAKASAILAYREAQGAFYSIEDIKQVEGIKDGVFEKIKNYIKV